MANLRTKSERKKLFTPRFFVRFGLLLFCIYLVTAFVFVQMEIVEKKQQLKNLTQQADTQKAKNQELQRVIDAADKDVYMERVARERLNYVRPDEKVYIDMSGK